MLWGGLSRFDADAPPILATKAVAVAAAEAALDERETALDDSWRTLPSVVGDVGAADRFVWQSGGPEIYRSVVGTHIEAPHWQVRYARFEGDVVERAEEHLVHVDPAGRAERYVHALPEGRSGAALSRDEARERAHAALREDLGLDPSGLREVSAEPAERPSRRDWAFVFEDPAVSVGDGGEARIAVTLAGDEVVDVFRHVHVPEEWQRAEQERATLGAVVANVCGFPVGLGLLAAAVAGLVGWSRGRFARGTFVVATLGLGVVMVLQVLNAWPVASAAFDTTQAWGQQALVGVGGGVVAAGFLAVLLGLVAGFVHRWIPAGTPTTAATRVLRGGALGAAWAGLGAAATAAAPSLAPVWGSLSSAGTTLPWAGPTLDAIRGWALQTLLLLLLFALAGALSRRKGRSALAGVLLLVSGLVFAGAGGVPGLGVWLATGLATGVVLWLSYVFVVRSQPAVVPIAVGTMAILSLARGAQLAAYPGAAVGAALAVVLLGALSVWWSGRLEADGAA